MNVKFTIIVLLIGVALFSFQCEGFYSPYKPNNWLLVNAIQSCATQTMQKKQAIPLVLSDHTPFVWSNVYMFSGTEDKKTIEKVIGFTSNSLDRVPEDTWLICFTNENTVVNQLFLPMEEYCLIDRYHINSKAPLFTVKNAIFYCSLRGGSYYLDYWHNCDIGSFTTKENLEYHSK